MSEKLKVIKETSDLPRHLFVVLLCSTALLTLPALGSACMGLGVPGCWACILVGMVVVEEKDDQRDVTSSAHHLIIMLRLVQACSSIAPGCSRVICGCEYMYIAQQYFPKKYEPGRTHREPTESLHQVHLPHWADTPVEGWRKLRRGHPAQI